jgi:hypothetical protein
MNLYSLISNYETSNKYTKHLNTYAHLFNVVVGARCGPSGSRGGGWHGVEEDVVEERVHDVDPTTIDEAPAWTRQKWRQGGGHGGGVGTQVAGEMIVVRVRI